MEKKILASLALTMITSLAFAMDDMSKTDATASHVAGSSSASSHDMSMSSFESMDTDKDGTLSRSEYDNHSMQMKNMQGGSMDSMSTDGTVGMGSDGAMGSSVDTRAPGIQTAPQSPGVGGADPGVAEQETAHKKADQ